MCEYLTGDTKVADDMFEEMKCQKELRDQVAFRFGSA